MLTTRKLESLKDFLTPGKLYQTSRSLYAFPATDYQPARLRNNVLPAYSPFMFLDWQQQTYTTSSGEEHDTFLAILNVLIGKHTYKITVYDGLEYDFKQII